MQTGQQVAVEGIFEVEILGLDGILTRMNAYEAIATQSFASQELDRAMGEGVRAIAARAGSRAPNWRGALASSMTSRVMSTSSVIIGEVYSTVQPPVYALVMEYGRRAGAKPPPVEAIRPWVEDKLGDGSLAIVIARSIGRKGIKPHYFLRQAFRESEAAVLAAFDRALARIAQRLAG